MPGPSHPKTAFLISTKSAAFWEATACGATLATSPATATSAAQMEGAGGSLAP